MLSSVMAGSLAFPNTPAWSYGGFVESDKRRRDSDEGFSAGNYNVSLLTDSVDAAQNPSLIDANSVKMKKRSDYSGR